MSDVVTLAEAKAHLRVNGSAEDGQISDYIAAAVEQVERATGLALTPRALDVTLDSFGDRIPVWPVTAITSVAYLDNAGAAQIVAPTDYRAALTSRPVCLAPRSYWPVLGTGRGLVTVTIAAGYAEGQVPPLAKQAVYVLLSEFYTNRGAGSISDDAQRAMKWLVRDLRTRRL